VKRDVTSGFASGFAGSFAGEIWGHPQSSLVGELGPPTIFAGDLGSPTIFAGGDLGPPQSSLGALGWPPKPQSSAQEGVLKFNLWVAPFACPTRPPGQEGTRRRERTT
jgi:hypothetical protein